MDEVEVETEVRIEMVWVVLMVFGGGGKMLRVREGSDGGFEDSRMMLGCGLGPRTKGGLFSFLFFFL